MMTGSQASLMKSITAERLTVGLFIHLDHSWREHPFIRSSFQISSPKDISQIEEHGLTKITYDPEKSTPESLRSLEGPVEAKSNDLSIAETSPIEEACANTEESVSVNEAPEPDQLFSETSDTPPLITPVMRREAIQKAKRAYNQAMLRGRAMHNVMAEDPERGVAIATDMVTAMLDDAQGETAAISLANTTTPSNPIDEALMHSLNVTAVSMVLGRELGLSQDDVSAMGLGAVLLSLGSEVAETIPTLSGATNEVIRRCGEKPGGSPDVNDSEDDRGIASQIVSVVQSYDQMTNNGTQDGPTPTEALSTLFKQNTGGRSAEIVTALICSMTIYPPGSFVKLTDGSIAMVISPNPDNRMKPVVLRHDANIPADKATFLDLLQEEGVAIQEHISRKSLNPEVLDYLNPGTSKAYYLTPAA